MRMHWKGCNPSFWNITTQEPTQHTTSPGLIQYFRRMDNSNQQNNSGPQTVKTPWTQVPVRILAVLFLLLVTGCTGINDKQLALDPTYSETERLRESISLYRAEFFHLKNEYILTLHPAHLRRMDELITLVRDDFSYAQYFKKNVIKYHKGIDHKRWQSSQRTYVLAQITICEMLLTTGELQLLYAKDTNSARTYFSKIVSEFGDEAYSAYVERAQMHLDDLDSGRYVTLLKETKSRRTGKQQDKE